MQAEQGTFPTSIIHTDGAPVTREADLPVRQVGDEYNPDTFTIYWEGVAPTVLWHLTSGNGANNSTNSIYIREGVFVFDPSSDGHGKTTAFSGIPADGVPIKIALAFNKGVFALSYNGQAAQTYDASGVVTSWPQLSEFAINHRPSSNTLHIPKNRVDGIRVYPHAISAAELEALTA